MSNFIQPLLIICAGFIGAVSIIYFYFSTDIFSDILKRPLKLISAGMLAIDVGIVLVALTAYESSKGVNVSLFNIPLSTAFYFLYFLGVILIILGSRKFTSH